MGVKAKEICKWEREDYAEELDRLRAIVRHPRYVCLKCGRVADKKKWL